MLIEYDGKQDFALACMRPVVKALNGREYHEIMFGDVIELCKEHVDKEECDAHTLLQNTCRYLEAFQ